MDTFPGIIEGYIWGTGSWDLDLKDNLFIILHEYLSHLNLKRRSLGNCFFISSSLYVLFTLCSKSLEFCADCVWQTKLCWWMGGWFIFKLSLLYSVILVEKILSWWLDIFRWVSLLLPINALMHLEPGLHCLCVRLVLTTHLIS